MRVLGLAAVLAVTGCVSVLPEAGPAPEIYRLAAAPAGTLRAASVTPDVAGVDWIVVVPEPIAPRALSTDRIAVVAGGDHISYAAGARWNERAPRVVQEHLLTAFEDDARVRAAVRPEDGVDSRYELLIDLLRFEAVYGEGRSAPPTIEVSVRAKLVSRDDRDLVGQTRIRSSRSARANRMTDVVAAFDAALIEVGSDVVDWTLSAGGAPGPSAEGPDQPSARAASSSR